MSTKVRSMLKATLLAATFSGAVLASAQAAEGNIGTDSVYMFNSEGRYTSGKLTEQAMARLMRNAKPIRGVIIVMSKGKLYMVDDPRGTLYQRRMDMVSGN